MTYTPFTSFAELEEGIDWAPTTATTNVYTYERPTRDGWESAIEAMRFPATGNATPIYGQLGPLYDYGDLIVRILPDGNLYTVLKKGEEEEAVEPPEKLVELLEHE